MYNKTLLRDPCIICQAEYGPGICTVLCEEKLEYSKKMNQTI